MYSEILMAFEIELKQYADSRSVPVAWPNLDTFSKGSSRLYLEPFFLPAETAMVGISPGSFNDQFGIYQINVRTRKGTSDTGDVMAESVDEVDSLLANFSKAKMLRDLVLIERSWASPVLDSGDSWLTIPVSIRYRVLG